MPFNEQRLEDDFARLTAHLLQAGADTFLYRDFQSRNIMIRAGEPWFVDFQGGRNGAPHYDVASLLYDAKANVPPAVREALIEHYLDALGAHLKVDRARFRAEFTSFVLVRLMQAMGACGYRGFFERKRRFLESVPNAADNLDRLLAGGLPIPLPELERVFRVSAGRWAGPSPGAAPLRAGPPATAARTCRQAACAAPTGAGGGSTSWPRAQMKPSSARAMVVAAASAGLPWWVRR